MRSSFVLVALCSMLCIEPGQVHALDSMTNDGNIAELTLAERIADYEKHKKTNGGKHKKHDRGNDDPTSAPTHSPTHSPVRFVCKYCT